MVELSLFDYDNPTGTCYDPRRCVRNDGQHRCCDGNDVIPECTGNYRCDSYFIYCLRSLGSEGQGCRSNYERRISTHNQDDNTEPDVTQNMVLGLENPLILRGITDNYDVRYLNGIADAIQFIQLLVCGYYSCYDNLSGSSNIH